MTNDDDARPSATRRDRDQLRAEEAGEAAEPAPGRKGGWLRETAIVVVSALVLSVLIKTFLVQAFFIPSGSMEDTFAVGDRVLVSKLAPGPLDVSRGDVVVFVDPGGWLEPRADTRNQLQRGVEEVLTFVGLLPQNAGEHLIKRIIGLGGDTVECCDADGRLTVNGVGIDEPYLKPGVTPSEIEFSVTVPENHLWLMGDNRSNSQDSRAHQGDPGGGAVPMRNVVGTAVLILWPFDSWSVLRNPGDTFAEVPAP
ncbi:signal peptidase I [Georgenia satyanarayanai]|uniref:signal peptidase I n=1 Tax=Georgenia satyanarayanai TaxID=860221 RepID=UPI0012656F35|nr:signal peptidase I [Georgenia satyanarayanai]